MGWRTQLSPEVARALPVVAAEMVRQMDRWAPATGGVFSDGIERAESLSEFCDHAAVERESTEP